MSKIILRKKVTIQFDKTKPNGVFRKVLNISLAKKYGWKPKINLTNAILKLYKSYEKDKKK